MTPLAMSGIDHRDEERRQAARPALEIRLGLLLKRLQPADAAAEHHPSALARECRHGLRAHAGIAQRFVSCGNRVLREPVEPLRLLAIQIIEWIEPFDLAGEMRRKSRGIEGGDRCRAALAGEESFPEGRDGQSDWGDRPDSGHDHALATATIRRAGVGRAALGCRAHTPPQPPRRTPTRRLPAVPRHFRMIDNSMLPEYHRGRPLV